MEPIEEGGSIEISEGSSIESLEGGSIEFSARQLRKKSTSSNEKYNEFKEIGTRLAQAAAKWRGKSYDKLLEVANFLLDKAEGQEQDLSEFHVSMFKSSITELPTGWQHQRGKQQKEKKINRNALLGKEKRAPALLVVCKATKGTPKFAKSTYLARW